MTRTIWGYIYAGEQAVAAYFVQWTRNMPGHSPNFDFLVGTWGDDKNQDKKLTSWILNPTQPGGAFMAIDGASRPAAGSELCTEALTREQVVNDGDLMGHAKALINAVWLGDPRISEIRGWIDAA